MPEPFSDNELVTRKTSIKGNGLWPKQGAYILHTYKICLDLYTCDERETHRLLLSYHTPALKSAGIKGADEEHQHREGHAHIFEPILEECYNSSARICLCDENFTYYVIYDRVNISYISLETPFTRDLFEFAWRRIFTSEDDTVAVKKKYQYPPVSRNFKPLRQIGLDKDLKCICNEARQDARQDARQKDREHPDDSGKLTNRSHRHKISLPQKRDTLGGMTDQHVLQTTVNVKMKRNSWEIGWKITFTRNHSLVYRGFFLLFILLLWPKFTQGTNQHEACVKHAFSEPLTECGGLFGEIKQHQVYWCRMQKSIDKAMASLVRYSEDYQKVLDIVYKGNRSYTAIEINEVDNGKILPAPLPMTEDMGSKGKKLGEPNSSTAKMGKSAQDGVNNSFEFLVLESCLGLMMILFSTFIIWVKRKKLDLIEFEDCHKDEKKDSRPLNNIQATAQTENRDQDKLVSSLTGSMSSVKLPLACTTDQSEKYVYSRQFSYKSLQEVKDVLYKEYPSSLMPDLPNIPTIGFSELDTSKCMIFSPEYNETFMGTDYCKNNTNLKQLSADNETCRLKVLVNDTDVSSDTCLKKCVVEVPSDGKGTSFEDSDCTKSITSSYPIQSRSLSDRKTSLYTSSLSSYVPSGQTGEMKESPVKMLDPISENIVEESHLETENFSESEKKQPQQILSPYQQHIDGDMKSRDITEHEWLESEQQETDEGHVDFSDFESNCVTDSEDDSQITQQNGKVDAYFSNIKESHPSQSTTNNTGYRSVVENHSLITLEEFDNAHPVKENGDRQIPVETANFQNEKENAYPECLKGNICVENMKENCFSENMKGFTNSQTDREHTNSGKTMVKSQNFQENAKIIEENASFEDCRQTTKSENFKADSNDLNVNVHAFQQNAEENADMQNVEENTNSHNVEDSSDLQKVKVNMYSENIEGNSYLHVKKDGHCHIDKGNDTCLTSLNPPTGANEDKSVPMEEKSFTNVQTKQLDSAESKVEASEVKDTLRISCLATSEFEYFQKYFFNVILNAPPQNVEENADIHFKEDSNSNSNMHVKEECYCHILTRKNGCLTCSKWVMGENEDKSEKHFINGKANLVDIDLSTFVISEVEDISGISCGRMMVDLGENKSLHKEDISPVSLGIEGLKEADSKFNEKMKETEQHCNDMEELCKSNKEDNRTLLLAENIQADVDDGTTERVYVESMQNDVFNEETDTMIRMNDTLNVGTAPSVETAEENVSDKPMPLKVLREKDQKTELISSFREKRSALKKVWYYIICLYKPVFEEKPGLSLLFPWKMRMFQTSTVLKDDPFSETNVKEEITCTDKDHYMVSVLIDTIGKDITWTNKKYIQVRDISSVVFSEGQAVSSQSSLSEDEGFSEKSVQTVTKSYTLEKVEEEDMSLIRLNKEGNLQGNNVQFTNLNMKEEDGKLHVNSSSEEIISTVEETIEGDIIRIKDEIKVQDNLPVISDEVEEASGRSTISEDEGFSSESFETDSKCCSQENMQEENVSQIKLNRDTISKGKDEQLARYNTEAEVLKPNEGLEEILPTDKKINERDLTWTKGDIKVEKTLSVILDEAETASISRTITEDKVVTEKSVEQDNKCLKQENVKEVSFAKLRGEKDTLNEVNCDCEKNTLKDKNIFEANITEKSEKTEKRCLHCHHSFGHTEVCDSTEHEFETEKGDTVDEQKPDSFAVHDNVEDKESQVQPVVKQKIGHTEPDITGEKVKCGAPPYLCSPKQVADTVGCTQLCLTSNFKTDSKDRDPGFKMIKYGSARGPNSQVGDPSENMINEFDVKLKRKLGNECHQKQNPSLGLRMKIPSVACGLKSVSHQRLKKSAGFQKKHRYLSRLKNRRNSDSNRVNTDLVSYKTDESDSGLLNTAEDKTKDYSNAICKAQRKPWTKKAHRDHSYITGESSFLKNQQKNSFGKVGKLQQFPQNHDFLFPFLQSPQQNSDLDKDVKLKSAIRKRRLRQSHLYTSEEQCSSFDKPSNGGFEMQQGLPKPIKLETNVTKMKSRIILNESIKWTKRKRHITRSESWTSYDRSLLKLGDTRDTSENPSFESSSTDILEQNLRPELDQVVSQTVGESIDSGLGTIESYRSDVILKMDTLEHAFHHNNVKLSSKKLKKLEKKLRKKERKIKKELSGDYMNAVFNPLFFRPELSSVIVYPGLQRYFQRLDEGPLSREESLSFEWLRLESLRNYDGAGSIIQLARGGFYHDPVDGPLSTRCYACNVLYTNWEYFDNVTEVHRRLSPSCPHLRENASVSGNVSIDDGPVNNQPNRTGSSVTVETPEDRANESDSQSATTVNSITDALRGTQIRDMVAEGFPQQPTEDRLNTEYNRSSPSLSASGPGFSLDIGPRTERNTANQSSNTESGQTVNNTATSVKSGNRPDVENQPNPARQPTATTTAVSSPVFTGASKVRERNLGSGGFAQNTASSAQTSQQTETDVEGLNSPHLVHVTNPKYSEYATVDSRSRSFTSMWPSYLDQTPQQMANAGFFYAGVADFTRCFACGGGLRNWEAGDDPCLEHTRWYPRCEYMNKLKGSRYVAAVRRRQEQHLAEERRRNEEQQAQRRQAATNVSQDPMATPAAQTLLEMGYSRERTKEAILAVRRNTGHNFVSAEQALIWILDRDEQDEEQPQVITAAVTATTTTGSTTSSSQGSSTTSSSSSQSSATTSSSSSQSSNESGTSSSSSSSASSGATGQGQERKGQGKSQSSPSGREKSGTATSDDKNTAAENESSEQRGANANGSQAQSRQKKKGKKKGKGGGANGKVGGASGLKGGANKEEEVAAASVPTDIDTQSLKAENEKLKEMQTCKICMDNPVNVTLLPCGHLVCCESCSPHLRKCPICRRRIDGSIKTFMS